MPAYSLAGFAAAGRSGWSAGGALPQLAAVKADCCYPMKGFGIMLAGVIPSALFEDCTASVGQDRISAELMARCGVRMK